MSSNQSKVKGRTRRAVLKAGLGCVAVPAVAFAGTSSLRAERRTLVLLQLAGGNDGLNTIIPYADPLYYELRPTLSAVGRQVLPLNGEVGLHPALAPLQPLYAGGQLAIVQGVGYAEPDYSHAGSSRMWATGQVQAGAPCWWSTVLDLNRLDAVCLGERPFDLASGARLVRLADTSAAATFAAALHVVASRSAPGVVIASLAGFDNHEAQLNAHARALQSLAEGVAWFQAGLDARGIAERVMVVIWSEFGRRPAENAAGGTDHGAAGPVLLVGRGVRGGLHGQAPSLARTDFGNLIAGVDFRSVYAALATQWLGCAVEQEQHPRLQLVAKVAAV